MEIFYSDDIQGPILSLPAEEAAHCVRVLRHRPGDHIDVIDGRGTLYHCTLLDPASDLADTPSGAGIDLPVGGGSKNGRKCSSPQGLGVGGASKTAKNAAAPFRSRGGHSASTTVARIDSSEPGWHSHPYRLTLAVCPTKNPDRYEWMAEKATEVGFDVLVPVIGDRSERKVLGKEERLQKILLSAAKQSLKGAVPQLAAPVSVRDFIASLAPASSLRLIAYCSDEVQPRASIMALLRDFWHSAPTSPEVIVLIGPEGDFSPEEVRAAIAAGFIPVSLGASRLRTETAAVTAAEAVYLSLL
ncbi:MAG: 16S rRNA (uracil(1498)-N(3))-methyltransferase [Bacteroidales bacterium]|nr:16S rRNA (uracil(1498)-N(3))-methyltransferase [Bacteroidales bacterium]